MTYQKTTWKNRLVERPGTYTLRQNADGSVTLLSAEGNVVEAGTPVNAENMNKIENALLELFTTAPVSESRLIDIVQSLETTGYRKLPGGLILQWGGGKARISRTADGSYWGESEITFPTLFPNLCLYAHAISRDSKTYSTASYGIDGSMLKGFRPQFTSFNGTDCNFMWFSFGY